MRAVGGSEAQNTHAREAVTVVYQFRIGSFAQEKQTWANRSAETVVSRAVFFWRWRPEEALSFALGLLLQKAARGIINANMNFLLF